MSERRDVACGGVCMLAKTWPLTLCSSAFISLVHIYEVLKGIPTIVRAVFVNAHAPNTKYGTAPLREVRPLTPIHILLRTLFPRSMLGYCTNQ